MADRSRLETEIERSRLANRPQDKSEIEERSVKKNPQPESELTPEEKRFIVQTLQQLELRGNAEALRQAVELIENVVRKLGASEDLTSHC